MIRKYTEKYFATILDIINDVAPACKGVIQADRHICSFDGSKKRTMGLPPE
jgi:hypothetical protein